MNRAQTDRILTRLKDGGTITAAEAVRELRCYRLAARIKELREDGWNIKTEMIQRNGKRYARYYI